MIRKNKLSTRKLITISFLWLILVSVFFIAYINYTTLDVRYVDFDYKVKGQQHLGFNADTDGLHFGTINQGGAGIRDLEISSEKRARVLIKVLDADNVFPNRNDFIIEPNQTTSVQFMAIVPADTPIGNYSGKVRIIFKRP